MRAGVLKWAAAAGLLAAGVQAYRSRSVIGAWVHQHQYQVPGLEQAFPCEVYRLEADRWLEFDIAADSPQARLISNAIIPSGTAGAGPGAEWPYAIEYEFAGGGAAGRGGVYHFKAGQLLYVDTQTGQPVDVNFFLDRGLSPLGGQYWQINLQDPEFAGAKRLRLRLHSRHADILEVGVRVYYRTSVPERKTAYLWSRLSEEQKRDLSRGNVYGFEGLTPSEKACLLRYHWTVAAPKGIPRRDYARRTLFVREEAQSVRKAVEDVPPGIYVDPAHRAVLALTNGPGLALVQLRAESSAPNPAANADAVSVTVLRRGVSGRSVETNAVFWQGTNCSLFITNGDALVEIGSARAAYIRAFQIGAGATNEITPQPLRVPVFACSRSTPVSYAVEHTDGDPTLFRLDIRNVPPADADTSPAEAVNLELTDSGGSILRRHHLLLTNAVSPHDWQVTTNGLSSVSEAQSVFFLVPQEAASLRVSCPSGAVLVNAYTRPYRLPKELRLPDDYQDWRAFEPEQPSWFAVRPPDYQQRRDAGLAAFVQVQPRLPEMDPRIRAGEYAWDAFAPESDALGHMVLLPLEESRAPRPESRGFTFFPLEPDGAGRVRFVGEPWQPQVSPTLLLVAADGLRPATAVTVDGLTVFSNRLGLPVTQLRLGSLDVGAHEVVVRTETGGAPAAVWVNYLEKTAGPAYLQRFCVMAHSNVLAFACEKQQRGPELLALRVFSPRDSVSPRPYRVWMKLRAAERETGPFPDITLLERQAEVTPAAGGRSWLVSAERAALDDGQLIFFPVGSDLPPGRYTLEIGVSADTPRWLSLSRTTPGREEKLMILTRHR